MNSIYRILTRSAVAFSIAALLPSCAMETPFGDGPEANLTLTTEINSEVKNTRALSADELTALREKCVVYIETEKGVIRKYKGVDNIPENIRLRTGHYVAEAWSGDSVSASFDAKFYRGKQEFDMTEGNNSLTLKCNIANVVVSVDPSSLGVKLSKLKVTFSHSRGELVFTEDNIDSAKGYFMMPNADKDLNYKIEGIKEDGSAYEKSGKIENVERAHEYCLKISEDASEITAGGALIRINIEKIPLYESEVEIFTGPKVRGVGFDIEGQVVSTDRNFSDTKVYVRAYFALSTLNLNFSDNFTGMTSTSGLNVLDNTVIDELKAKGIYVERSISKEASSTQPGGKVNVEEVYVTFKKSFLDALPASESEYRVTFSATDSRHKTGTGTLRIANDNAAVEHLAPVVPAEAPDPETEPMAVGVHTATLTGYLNDPTATNFGIRYREQGTSAWSEAYPSSANASSARHSLRHGQTRAAAVAFQVTVTALKEGTTYEYKVFCDGFESDVVNTITTESKFVIPNASFEEWSTYEAVTLFGNKNVILPWGVGDKYASFWGSGNEGAATANKTLTNKSTDMVHTGTYSARLASDAAMGVLAAGNIFVGNYAKTVGTNGEIEFGRPYNGSHPTKVRVWANYRPGVVNIIMSGNESYLDFSKGDNDHGQIYVALTDETIYVRTDPENQKLFSPDDPHVLAYGQVTWTGNFGSDGQLQMVEIPFTYNERANSKRPTHLIITCCASKYGDYFSGSSSSVMYLDDFELVYE